MTASTPSILTSAQLSLSFVSSRPASARFAPASASLMASARPMPPLAPVISAVLPGVASCLLLHPFCLKRALEPREAILYGFIRHIQHWAEPDGAGAAGQ
jgi:hypothetical protein